jgi:hypothetical protein
MKANRRRHEGIQEMPIATGFDFEPLPDGNVLVEFFGDDGKTFNKQVVTGEVVRSIPLVAILTDIALKRGPDVAKEIMEKLNLKGSPCTHRPI